MMHPTTEPTLDGASAIIGSGYIGRHLLEHERARGRRCRAYTRATPVVDAYGHLDAYVRSCSTVFYLASSITPSVAESDPELGQRDLCGLETFLDSLVKQSPNPPTVILSSSGGTLYSSSESAPFSEDAKLAPTNRYGEFKLKAEQILSSRKEIRSVVARLANVYGPGQPARRGYGVLSHWIHRIVEDEAIDFFGDSTSMRDYVYVGDVCRALSLIGSKSGTGIASRSGGTGCVYNIGSGTGTTLQTLLGLLNDVADRPIVVNVSDARTFDQGDVILNIGRARRELGWTPLVELTEGVKYTWAATQRLSLGNRIGA